MDNRLFALAECVAQGIDDGWAQARRVARQPTREQWHEAIYTAVMRRIEHLLQESEAHESRTA